MLKLLPSFLFSGSQNEYLFLQRLIIQQISELLRYVGLRNMIKKKNKKDPGPYPHAVACQQKRLMLNNHKGVGCIDVKKQAAMGSVFGE